MRDSLLHGRLQVAGLGLDSCKVLLVEHRRSRQKLYDETDILDTLDNSDVIQIFVSLIFGIYIPADVFTDERDFF